MALATLTIDVNARLASIEKDLGRLAQMAQSQADKMDAAFSTVGATVAGMFAGVSFTAITSAFKNVVDQIDALNDAADATGASIENISGLEEVAKRTGASLDTVNSILIKFNAALKEADPSNAMGQALAAIGVDAKELKSIDPAEALLKTATALSNFADDGNKARIVQELFGKSIKEAAPFLKDLADAGKLNTTTTAAQTAEAEKFNKQIFALQTNIDLAARSIVSSWLPAVNKMFDVLNDKDAATVSAQIKEFEDALKKEPYNQEYKRRLDELRAAYAAISKEAKGAAGLLDAGGGRGFINPEIAKPNLPDTLKVDKSEKPKAEKTQDIDREIEALRKKLQTVRDLTETEKLLDDLERGRFKDASVSKIGQAFDVAGQIDQAKELEEVWKQLFQTLDDSQKASAKDFEEAQRYFEASLSPAEKLEQTITRINDLYEKGAFGVVGSADAIEKQARAIKAAKNETDQLNDAARELADIFTRAAERGDDLGKALETIIKKKLLFDPIARSLESGFQSLFSFAGSFFGGSTTSSNPGQYALSSGSGEGLKLPGHKDGLDYVPYDNYVARLHKGERVLTAQQNSEYGQSGVVVNNYNTIGSQVSRADLAAAMETSRQQTLATLIESRRNRGAFS